MTLVLNGQVNMMYRIPMYRNMEVLDVLYTLIYMVLEVMKDLEVFHSNFDRYKADFDTRLDDAESQRAVFSSQIDVLKEINSVKALRESNREMATLQAEVSQLRKLVDHLIHIHNSKHPKI